MKLESNRFKLQFIRRN